MKPSTEVLVIGSGAGGALTAATLAEAGLSVTLVEEGSELGATPMETHSPEALLRLYRNAGLSPILGTQSIAFGEGRCVGGSTEVNSAFWHRPPADALERWRSRYAVRELGEDSLAPLFLELERELQPRLAGPERLPPGSRVLARGLERCGLPARETPRLQSGDPTTSQFGPGAKRSMSRTYIPRALAAGATLVSGTRAVRIHHRRRRATGASLVQTTPDGPRPLRIEAETIFVCGGAIQTPVLLRASRIRNNVGNSLRIQPMLKVAAEFDEVLNGHEDVMPVYQMRDPASGIFLGGSVFTPGFLGMTLSDRWPENESALARWRHMGLYYTACRGSGRGSVRVFPGTTEAIVRYGISAEDRAALCTGLARLCEILFAGGSRRVYPGVRGAPPLESLQEVRALRESGVPLSRMSLSTVHVSSTCPMGEDRNRCAVDSFGRLHGFENLHLADASIVPDAPGVNPQGTIMALVLRNLHHFLAQRRGR